MALLCNDVEIKGKNKQMWCIHTGTPCAHVRFCAVSGKYYQTDNAAKCKVKEQTDGKTR